MRFFLQFWGVFTALTMVGAWAEAPRPQASPVSIRLLTMWELDKLASLNAQKGRPNKLSPESLKDFPSAMEVFKRLGISPDADIDLAQLRDRLSDLDENENRLLASLLRVQARVLDRETEKAATASEKRAALTSAVDDELKKLEKEGELPLSPSLKNQLSRLVPESERDRAFDSQRIREILKSDKAEKLSPDTLLQLLSSVRGTAFDRLGNEFFEGATAELPGPAGKAFHRAFEERARNKPARIEERSSSLPQQRFTPAIPGSRIAPFPRVVAPGRVEFGSKPSRQQRFFAAPPEFSGTEQNSLSEANSDRGRASLAMEMGAVSRDALTGALTFVSQSVCQATPIGRTYGAADKMCRFVLSSAKHCFENRSDTIRLDGFARPLNRDQFRVVQSSSASGEDFAALIANAPCSTPIEPVELAPRGSVAPGGLVALDVHRHGERVLDGKSFQSEDSGYLGINAIGSGEIIPGDSGGGAYAIMKDRDGRSKKFYVGALSSKYTNGAFQDGVGLIARTPDWFYDELPSFLSEPLPAELLASRRSGPTEARSH